MQTIRTKPIKQSGKSSPNHNGFIVLFFILLLFIAIPFALEHYVFQSKVPSALTNGEWSAFLGSYIGGIIGGFGTIIAVIMSTTQTDRIQSEQREESEVFRRQEFAYKISEEVARFVSTALRYQRNIIDGKISPEREEALITTLSNKQQEHKEWLGLEHTYSYDGDEILKWDAHKNILEADIERLKFQIQILNEKKVLALSNKTDFEQVYFFLKIGLSGVKDAKNLLNIMDSIIQHVEASNFSKYDLKSDCNRLITITEDFAKKYVG